MYKNEATSASDVKGFKRGSLDLSCISVPQVHSLRYYVNIQIVLSAFRNKIFAYMKTTTTTKNHLSLVKHSAISKALFYSWSLFIATADL